LRRNSITMIIIFCSLTKYYLKIANYGENSFVTISYCTFLFNKGGTSFERCSRQISAVVFVGAPKGGGYQTQHKGDRRMSVEVTFPDGNGGEAVKHVTNREAAKRFASILKSQGVLAEAIKFEPRNGECQPTNGSRTKTKRVSSHSCHRRPKLVDVRV